jgi:hypothetical protein
VKIIFVVTLFYTFLAIVFTGLEGLSGFRSAYVRDRGSDDRVGSARGGLSSGVQSGSRRVAHQVTDG